MSTEIADLEVDTPTRTSLSELKDDIGINIKEELANLAKLVPEEPNRGEM